jgi:hypothetical protein
MVIIRILFAVDVKYYSFWPSADIKPTSNELVHAMNLHCMFGSLSLLHLYGNNKVPALLKKIRHFPNKTKHIAKNLKNKTLYHLVFRWS